MKLISLIDKVNDFTGKMIAWFCVPLAIVVVYEVSLRFIFNKPTSWVYDMSWMLNSALFLLGGGYTLLHRRHVRVDILYRMLPKKFQCFYDFTIYLIVILPITIIFVWQGIKYASFAWKIGERLSTTLWDFPAGPSKTLIPIAFALVGLQAIAELGKTFADGMKGDRYES